MSALIKPVRDEADALEHELVALGFCVRREYSGASNSSVYLFCFKDDLDLKIRVCNHDALPVGFHRKSDYDVRTHGNRRWWAIAAELSNAIGQAPSSTVKAAARSCRRSGLTA